MMGVSPETTQNRNTSPPITVEDQSKHHRRNCNNGLEHGVITIIVLGFLLKAFDRCANELM